MSTTYRLIQNVRHVGGRLSCDYSRHLADPVLERLVQGTEKPSTQHNGLKLIPKFGTANGIENLCPSSSLTLSLKLLGVVPKTPGFTCSTVTTSSYVGATPPLIPAKKNNGLNSLFISTKTRGERMSHR